VAARSKPWVYGRSPTEIVVSNLTESLDVCCEVCCQVQVSVSGWSLIQTSHTDCCACTHNNQWTWILNTEEALPAPLVDVATKNNQTLNTVFWLISHKLKIRQFSWTCGRSSDTRNWFSPTIGASSCQGNCTSATYCHVTNRRNCVRVATKELSLCRYLKSGSRKGQLRETHFNRYTERVKSRRLFFRTRKDWNPSH
jgi:hypothetical protein